MKILGIGNAIVDVICKVEEDFINRNNLTKGTMKLIFDDKEFQLLLLLYVCRKWEGEPKSMENNEIIWVKPNMLRKYKMPPADDALIYCIQDLF